MFKDTKTHNTNTGSMNVGLKVAHDTYRCILDLHVKSNLGFIGFDESRVIDLFKFIIKWLVKLIHSKVKGEFDYFFSEWFNIIKVCIIMIHLKFNQNSAFNLRKNVTGNLRKCEIHATPCCISTYTRCTRSTNYCTFANDKC